MGKFKFILDRARRLNTDKLKSIVLEVQAINKKPKFLIYTDIAICGFRYAAAPSDYLMLKFYKLPHKKRKTYITRGINNELIRKYNEHDKFDLCDDKEAFNKVYSDLLRRDWAAIDKGEFEKFSEFVKKHPNFVRKPYNESGGAGVVRINSADYESIEALYEESVSNGKIIVEQFITQHPDIAALNNSGANTLRFLTIRNGNKVDIVFCTMKIGRDSLADSFFRGSLCCPIDIETGVITKPAVDVKGVVYETHPSSNIKLVGMKIPNFESAKSLVREAATRLEGVNFIGWDIAIGVEEALIVEGNSYPAYLFYQFPEHLEDGIGRKAAIEKYL